MFFKSRSPKDQDARVSVIIPLYNHEKFISEAISSVLNQSYANLELIIIDDGSKDSSYSIAESFKDSRIILLKHENRGAHHTINRGLEMASGEYLTILNSDDSFEKDRLEKCLNYLRTNTDTHLVCSYIKLINEVGSGLGVKKGWENMEPWPIAHKDKSFAKNKDFIRNLLMSNFISTTSNMVFTKELYRHIGGMRNLRFAHDWDFALRAAEYGKCAIIESALMRYRLHGTNTINTNRKHMLFEICWIYAANLHRFEGIHIFNNDPLIGLEEMAESLNFQGNDKLVWLLRSYFNSEIKRGVKEPELEILNNTILRESLFKYIVE
ncbi:glycosyltransferase family 2 protein [Paenibacillus sp. LjRoot56]|uniref:glycosyltransferase family 2 protein n=1 Tax=Paenibacillus sp. LjRoot56 TaxID=3342333 RepID=UPI003ECE155A